MRLPGRLPLLFTTSLRTVVFALAVVSGSGVLLMMLLTCADVVLRRFGAPLVGAYDLVYLAGAVAMACAIPYTTALKGHVAIEFFFHQLNRTGRIVVDTVVRILGIGLFCLLAWESARIGGKLRVSGEVTATLQIPVFWVPWVMAMCCAVVALVILYNLTHPGKALVRP